MSERMDKAMKLARKCWKKALETEPEFVERYLEIAEAHLQRTHYVTGDVFRRLCAEQGLRRPAGLHPNVWVSGPNALKRIGWITKVGSAEPTEGHNHMPVVAQWRSNIWQEA